MGELGDLERNLRANLKQHEDYIRYLRVDYPKYLHLHLKKEIARKNRLLLDQERQKEIDKNEDRNAADSRNSGQLRIAMIGIVVAIIIALVTWFK